MEKTYDFKATEDKIYKKWEDSGLFTPENLDLPADAKTYTIVLPPPNVTGVLHVGHAGVLTIEDILIRYHRMKGERALWIPGTDHASIATQTKVEKIIKEEGETRHSLGRDKFLKRVQQFTQNSHDTIISQCKKMGASLDWTREAYTLDETRNKAVNLVFKLMHTDELIYRGERIVNWCPRCHSTLADDEVEYKENKTILYYFKYSKDFPITIATTRPETKLGDVAVAVNPIDKRYKQLIGQEYEVDFVGIKLKIKIIADHNVDMSFGTGALGVTPAHSAVDWQMAKDNNLPVIKVIDEDGKIRSGFNIYSDKTVKVAREMIVEKLKTAGLIEKEENIDNNLSLCYRCDTPVEPLPSLQWFINVNKKVDRLNGKSIKETCLEAVKTGVFGRNKINIIPDRFESIYFHWMENLRDWCISRQIWFGHRVPVWYKKTTDNKEDIFVGEKEPKEEGWVRDEDTLDTWFSSGMWTFSTLASSPEQIRIENNKLVIDSDDFRKYHPTQVLETAYDIIFFWIARMIIMTTYALNDIPFQDVYLQGLVLDEKGKKISKSKGNGIDPLDMIEKYGADATRLSLVLGSTPGNDLRLPEEKIAGLRNLVNKIWNISRYIIQNTEKQAPTIINPKNLTLADRWILIKLNQLSDEATSCLDGYKFSEAGEALREFTWDILADWYIETTKFIKGAETEKVLLFTLRELLKLWHPFIPFVTEVIWQEFNDTNLMVQKLEKQSLEIKSELLNNPTSNFDLIKDIISAIRAARAENKIEPGLKLQAIIFASEKIALLKENETLIKGLRTGLETLVIKEVGERPEKAIFIATSGIEIYLLGTVDEKKEKIRLKKSFHNLEQLIVNIEKKLANQEFIERAPQIIINKEKQQLEEAKQEKIKIEKQLETLTAH